MTDLEFTPARPFPQSALRECPSFPGYSVTRDGRVFTHRRRFGKGMGRGGGVTIDPDYCKELRPYPGEGDYLFVSVATRGRTNVSVPIHILLMDAFVGPGPPGLLIRHLDSDCRNNALSNLAYGTELENAADRQEGPRATRGQGHPGARLTEDKVKHIRRLHEEGGTAAGIARQFRVNEATVRDILKGRKWAHVR